MEIEIGVRPHFSVTRRRLPRLQAQARACRPMGFGSLRGARARRLRRRRVGRGTAADNDSLGGGNWRPTIDIETGRIEGWPQGTTASIHYKCCDDGDYELLDADRNVVKAIEGYVPSIMCPEGNGYGDYVIMEIAADGAIANWKPYDLAR